MKRTDTLSGVPLEDEALTIDEFACACAVEIEWIVERVEAGLISHVGQTGRAAREWRFASRELARARRMIAVERGFEANSELAALVADLLEEVQRLRLRLRTRIHDE
jgi:chaperone modulatory protein CbpM